MKEIVLIPEELPKIGLEADTISPDFFANKKIKEINNLSVFCGNEKLTLGDFFDIKGTVGQRISDIKIIIQGDVSLVKRIGQGMSGGEILIKGNAGMYVGAEMKGGTIVVEGDIGSFSGQRMRGGHFIIKGNAGNYLGASYRGDWRGMRGGEITVDGNVGSETGEFMVGGKIHIKGNCGPFIGIHMTKGLIIIEGDADKRVGAQMVGGTILVNGKTEMLPSFKLEGDESNLNINGAKFNGPFLKFKGDMAEMHSKGTVYIRK
jgi:formylmethanofuran dehydrogenase subunit C|tara:strand:- start:1341 stop:2126 length:786 start_codon:yes stop_codon:yes gene_type:complete